MLLTPANPVTNHLISPKPMKDWHLQLSPWIIQNMFWMNLFHLHSSKLFFCCLWATCDLCFCYTPGCRGITANELVWLFPVTCNKGTILIQFSGLFSHRERLLRSPKACHTNLSIIITPALFIRWVPIFTLRLQLTPYTLRTVPTDRSILQSRPYIEIQPWHVD